MTRDSDVRVLLSGDIDAIQALIGRSITSFMDAKLTSVVIGEKARVCRLIQAEIDGAGWTAIVTLDIAADG